MTRVRYKQNSIAVLAFLMGVQCPSTDCTVARPDLPGPALPCPALPCPALPCPA